MNMQNLCFFHEFDFNLNIFNIINYWENEILSIEALKYVWGIIYILYTPGIKKINK